jgi:oleandomycin transport system ATP-binding protein
VESDATFADVVRRLGEAGITAAELSLHLPSLDEVFFTLTGPTNGHGPDTAVVDTDPRDSNDRKAMANR